MSEERMPYRTNCPSCKGPDVSQEGVGYICYECGFVWGPAQPVEESTTFWILTKCGYIDDSGARTETQWRLEIKADNHFTAAKKSLDLGMERAKRLGLDKREIKSITVFIKEGGPYA